MPFQQSGSLRWFSFGSFESLDVVHGLFTRQGGVSPAPWASLNVGGTVGDHPERVRDNKARILSTLNITPRSVYDSWQVHGNSVLVVKSPQAMGNTIQRADAILTCEPDITLMMRFADCVPILLVDPQKWAVGLVHAGWKGTITGVVREAVKTMGREFGSRPEALVAGIGPSIGPDHYEIQADVSRQVEQSFGSQTSMVLRRDKDHTYFDLWTANRKILEDCGVGSIEVAEVCTACNLQDWFSHRAEHGKTGRFGGLIKLAN